MTREETHRPAYPDPASWPAEITGLRPKRLPDGRRVITGRDLAVLLACTPENLRKMAAAGRLSRETDLDESTRSWYRVEEAARAYLDKFPGRALDTGAPTLPFLARPTPADRAAAEAAKPSPTKGSATKGSDPEDKDALIRALAAALADKEAENKQLRAALADPRRRGLPLRRRSPKD